MSLFYLQIIGRFGSIILGVSSYAYIMHMLGARVQLRPFSVKAVEPTGRIRGGMVEKIEKKMKKHPTSEEYSIHVHKKLMKWAKSLRLQINIGFLVLITALILDLCFDVFQNGI